MADKGLKLMWYRVGFEHWAVERKSFQQEKVKNVKKTGGKMKPFFWFSVH